MCASLCSVRAVLVPRALLPLGCCEVPHAQGAVTKQGHTQGQHPRYRIFSEVPFAGGFGPAAII